HSILSILDRHANTRSTLFPYTTLFRSGAEIDRHKIVLERPIKDTGEHEVAIKLHHDVAAQLVFQVKSAEEPKAEAESAAADEPEKKKKHRFFHRKKEEKKETE